MVATTGAVAPITRELSRLTGTRRLPRWGEAAADAILAGVPGARVSKVVPSQQLARPRPTGQPPDHWCFARDEQVELPPAVVARIPGGRVVGGVGAVIAPPNTLLFDLSQYFGVRRPRQHPLYLRLRLPPVSQFPGTLGVLDCRGGDNYCHFLLDVLPRLGLLEAGGEGAVDGYYVPSRHPFQEELLAMVGIPGDRVLDNLAYRHLQASTLVVPSLPAPCLEIPPWTVSFLRGRLLGAAPDVPASRGRRIYVSRGRQRHSRRVDNEDQVVATLARWGFEVVDTAAMTVRQQIALFRDAQVVVAPHGAAL
ncbi:MAG TPA: glycosyltransferase family 61 protein, partial [Acidimicrobiales bacterium]|nr:glycosyltransferase family 61 protein [Acidimicrobiales bacterium]